MRDLVRFYTMGKKRAIPFVRDAYNYDTNEVSDETGLKCEDPSLTVQSEAEDADINVIVARFGLTGTIPQSYRLPEFADYEDVFDFQSAQNALIEGERSFMQLPAHVRKEFDNSPQIFLEACHETGDAAIDKANKEKLKRLGLIAEVAPVPEKVMKVEVVAGATSGGKGTESPGATK